MKDFASANIFTWCTNCGNYGINAAVRRALVELDIKPCETITCFDIGCNGNGADKIGGYTFHGLHGRVIPAACGAALANTETKVIAFGGDGGTLGEGVGHLVHGVRGNYNVTFILHNNLNYGLTKGQASPTTKKNMKMDSSPDGPTSEALHPVRFVLALESTFVARTFSGDVKHMTKVFVEAIKHPGFSFVEVFQSCPTYNKQTPHEWYQQRVFDVSTVSDYDPSNRARAFEIAEDIENKIAIGVLYKDKNSVPQSARQQNRAKLNTQLVEETRQYPIDTLLKAFR
ncbi:MAG: 2-oxoglutarate ferredoxin oxidoreductase subunit beta [Patescibacteria group bacterium]|nr:MAG: 2-oxoglutarate ferredoxin oxidoreductase subunit beta [Patescibacteria group bacterium]